MKVLVGCEISGIVRDAFRARGHDAWSCDIQPSQSPHHLQMDVREAIAIGGWDLGIFHPPCTRLCNSGVRWLHERDLWDEMADAVGLFLACLDAPIDRVAVENPIMHGHAAKAVGRKHDFTVQPWQFGDNFSKRTCFWTRNLPPLVRTSNLDGSTAAHAVHRVPPSKDRARIRSQTYPGMAAAMAEQWGIE